MEQVINRKGNDIMSEPIPLYSSLSTPAVLINLKRLEANIYEMSRLAAEAGVKLRPHIKVHGSVEIAKMQLEAGACGIEVGSIAQAEPMSDGGIDDILVGHPFYGPHKLEILSKLLNRPNLKLTVNVDMIEQAETISSVAQKVGRNILVLLKIDINVHEGGLKRFGVPPGKPALSLAEKLAHMPGIDFEGIYAHEMGGEPTTENLDKVAFQAASLMVETAEILKGAGIAIKQICVGGSPTFRFTCRHIKEGRFQEITEIHPGNCVIGDVGYMLEGGNTRENSAATVLVTVLSKTHEEFVVIDAGFKTLGADPLKVKEKPPSVLGKDAPSFGFIKGRPDLWLGFTHAESGIVYGSASSIAKLKLGERLEIEPNNATLAISIHHQLYGVRNGVIEKVFPVNCHGHGI
jgi:D-serine deaminase-like pyridoxal phosphate-dependent protein